MYNKMTHTHTHVNQLHKKMTMDKYTDDARCREVSPIRYQRYRRRKRMIQRVWMDGSNESKAEMQSRNEKKGGINGMLARPFDQVA